MADTTVVDTVGWKHVRNAYANLTKKLETAGIENAQKIKAIDYWTARLQEDRYEIDHGRPPRQGKPEPD